MFKSHKSDINYLDTGFMHFFVPNIHEQQIESLLRANRDIKLHNYAAMHYLQHNYSTDNDVSQCTNIH